MSGNLARGRHPGAVETIQSGLLGGAAGSCASRTQAVVCQPCNHCRIASLFALCSYCAEGSVSRITELVVLELGHNGADLHQALCPPLLQEGDADPHGAAWQAGQRCSHLLHTSAASGSVWLTASFSSLSSADMLFGFLAGGIGCGW